MRGIRIYVEGGGVGDSRTQLRRAFNGFLKSLVDGARRAHIRWDVVACGTRGAAFNDFCTALKTHQDSFNVLLVDSEGPVRNGDSAWEHLRQRDNWDKPSGVADHSAFLMVQCMETWIVADTDNLQQFYRQGFRRGSLPQRENLEDVSKSDIMSGLDAATSKCGCGKYHKTRHGFRLLETANSETVRRACPECDRLFSELERVLATTRLGS